MPADQPTTPGLLIYLMERAAEYQADRTAAEADLARAQKLAEQAPRRATAADPYAPAVSGAEKLAGSITAATIQNSILEMDRAWHTLVLDMLMSAPTTDDFDARALALNLPEEELARYTWVYVLKKKEQESR